MRSPLRILVIVVAVAIAAAACSSTVTTTQQRTTSDATNNEPATEPAEEAAEPGESADGQTESGAADDNSDEDTTADDGDEDRDADEDPTTARDLQSAPGFRLGDTEQLGALSDDCIAGNDMACDILFQLSGFDSEEEITAVTCGGRSDVEVSFCTDGIDTGATDLVFDEDSVALAAIVAACRDGGDMTACDFLYFRSPLESAFETIGATCGERVEVAVPDCRSFLSEDN